MRNIFRTKKHSTSKGNTTEKTEPIDGRQAHRGDHEGEGRMLQQLSMALPPARKLQQA
jgi:hypothetical protein